MSGYCIYLGDALVSWSSKCQPTVSRSSAEAEYRAIANAVSECCWLRQLLGELSVAVEKATVVYYDNISSVYMASNPVHHHRTKHIELDIHFVREKVAVGDVRVLHVPTGQQFADIMTKGYHHRCSRSFVPVLASQDPMLGLPGVLATWSPRSPSS
jgi:hypothetical protein